MRVLDRYIIKAVLGSVGLVLAVLLTLLALFLFIDEQGWVGVGTYGTLQSAHYVLLNLPATVVYFLPVAALIGALRATGFLARDSEITVMRAAGIPVWRLAWPVLCAGLLLVPLAVAVGEHLAPPLAQMARFNKAVQRDASISITARGSAWIPDGTRIMRAERLPGDAAFGGITVFEIAPGNQLAAVGQARGAHGTVEGGWELEGYVESGFAPGAVKASAPAAKQLDISASPAFFGAIAANPQDLSRRELATAIAHLKANGQDARRHRFAWWSKVAGLAAIPLAVLLAVPFMFGSFRSAQAGTRAMLGLAFGLGWFMLQRMMESGALVFAVDPPLLALLPNLLLTGIIAFLLLRLRGRMPH